MLRTVLLSPISAVVALTEEVVCIWAGVLLSNPVTSLLVDRIDWTNNDTRFSSMFDIYDDEE